MRDRSISRLCGILFIVTCTTFLLRTFLVGGLDLPPLIVPPVKLESTE